jgi:hypothetical protein
VKNVEQKITVKTSIVRYNKYKLQAHIQRGGAAGTFGPDPWPGRGVTNIIFQEL